MHSMKRHRTKQKRYLNTLQKNTKQGNFIKKVKLCNVALSNRVQCLTSKYIKKYGGHTRQSKRNFYYHRGIAQWYKQLHAQNIEWRFMGCQYRKFYNGITFDLQDESSLVFIHLLQNKSLSIMINGRSMCAAMHSCAWTQPQSLSRGKHNHIFTEDNNKYYCVGAQPGRAERGVQSGLYKLKHGFPSSDWDCIHKVLKHAGYAFSMFMDTDIIHYVVVTRQRINFRMMEWSPSSIHAKAARYYNGVGFGVNVFLRCHVDRDFTMSIVQVHMDQISYPCNDHFVSKGWSCCCTLTWRLSIVQCTGTTMYIFVLQ